MISQLRPSIDAPFHIATFPQPVQCEARASVGDVIYRCGLKPGHEEGHERPLVGPPGYGGRTITWATFYDILEGEGL